MPNSHHGDDVTTKVRKMARVLQQCGADVMYEEVAGKVNHFAFGCVTSGLC
jgi:hypothetical protein